MTSTFGPSFIAVVLLTSALGAQQPAPPPQLPRSQMPDLGRPTKSSDALPLFEFEMYFAGRWTFEWDVPDSPLGPAATLTGTTTFARIDDLSYEATTRASGPSGPFTINDTYVYRKESKALARHVADSRGFSFTEVGTVGGDLGGYYTMYFDSAPFSADGKTIRLRHTMRLLSPVNYKVEMRISVDGGPFTNFGTPWWRKDVNAAPPRP
jgi:uncharacterized protein DUF6314